MDLDELFAKRPDDPLTKLLRQDLDPMSLDELDERVEALRGEIARCEDKKRTSSGHMKAADALFKKS
jgi:uncharacterized small protein (DUF1192 family)